MPDNKDSNEYQLHAFKEILNGMDSFIYVTELNTDKILYINEKLAAHYGVNASDVIDKVCWQILPGNKTGRCEFCPINKLDKDPDSIISWIHSSKITGIYYKKTDRIIDIAGKKVHLQHAIDITDNINAEKALNKRLQQQELMTKISQSFISTEDIPILVSNALKIVGEFMGVSKIIMAAVDKNTNILNRRFSWFNEAEGITLGEKGNFVFEKGNVIYNTFIINKEPFVVCNNSEERPDFDYLRRFGVMSYIIIPIFISGEFWGLISVDDCRQNRIWDDSDIHFVRIIGNIISELIARNETEEQLLKMSSIVDSSPQCVGYIAEGGIPEYINNGAEIITGYTKQELIENGLYTLFDAETAIKLREEIRPAVISERKQTFEIPIIRKDREVRILFVSCFVTKAKAGGLGVIASDITEKRKLERELVIAKEQAEYANNAKSDFLSRMSHEMRTPMNAIIGMTNIAKNSSSSNKKDYCLEKIDSASNHLLGVINDVLDMSKIEANKFELYSTDFNFEKMLIKVTNVINYRMEEKGQEFLIKIDPEVPLALVGDEQRLAQVLTNLLGNAVKFTPEKGEISLLIRKVDETDDICTIEFEIKDNGIGISKEQQARLFSSFEQGDGSISRKFGGTGLGLAISKNIIKMMNGNIYVESEQGKGSSFIFSIKAKRGTVTAENRPRINLEYKNLNMLVVDDSSDVLEYFVNLAEQLKINCSVAGNGFEALKIIEDNSVFNIIFVDWKMEGIDGIELTRRIKQKYGENVIIIMISAFEWSVIEAEAKQAGVDRFISKPLFSSVIVDCINDCLDIYSDVLQAEPSGNIKNCFLNKHILLAEDIDINREILISLLEPTGVKIDCAENGKQVCEMFLKHHDIYDIIFMDIHMPEIDGYEATKIIRAMDIPRAKNIPIIAMTANVFKEDVKRCLETGMNDHIGKPIDFDEVIVKIQQYLDFNIKTK